MPVIPVVQEAEASQNLKNGAQWCTSIIPGVWEAETGKSQVQSQPRQLNKVLSNLTRPCLKVFKEKG